MVLTITISVCDDWTIHVNFSTSIRTRTQSSLNLYKSANVVCSLSTACADIHFENYKSFEWKSFALREKARDQMTTFASIENVASKIVTN